ncbi:MAG: GGDEF domain-containing protein [Lachnospiraceae bacterium]|nr:GGDEF domain-containing protein [Lachnospiraceae bacterium]
MKRFSLTSKFPEGIPANRIAIPVIAVLAFLHLSIISFILGINSQSGLMSSTMQKSGMYIEEATSVLAGSSLLSETSRTFVLMPITQNGEVNLHPLAAFASELKNEEHRGYRVLENFKTYDLEQDTLEYISAAAEAADTMLESQLHAIALVNSVYPIPKVSPVDSIPMPRLTEEEKTWSEERRMETANILVLGENYSLCKEAVSDNITACAAAIKQQMGIISGRASGRILFFRRALWAGTCSIIAILVIVSISLYKMMLIPLRNTAKLVSDGKPISEDFIIEDLCMVKKSYNSLMKRHDELDAILRSAANTDSLTSLPNRYAFEQYKLELENSKVSVAVIMFDVNYLKTTNDTQGHAFGDALLQNSAQCIQDCFSTPEGGNCFRLGGDEFVSIIKDVVPESLERMERLFCEDQERRKISIAWGRAFTEDISGTTFKDMMDEADRELYKCKERMHGKKTS